MSVTAITKLIKDFGVNNSIRAHNQTVKWNER